MQNNKKTKEAVVFIPGFDAIEKDYYTKRYLALGLANKKQAYLESEEIKISGQTGKRVTLRLSSEAQKSIDIYEVYWRDLVDDIHEKPIRYKVLRGFYLLFYWISVSFKIGKVSKIFFFQILGVLLLLVAWEYSTVTIALTAIGNDPNALGFQLPKEFAVLLGNVGVTLGGWKLWLVAGALLSILPVPASTLINLLDFMVHYAEDDIEKGVGSLRDKIRYRLTLALNDVFDSSEYSKVTVLSHSLGTVLAVDCIATYKRARPYKINFITLGSSLQSMSSVSAWVSKEITACFNNDSIETWDDFYSNQDWLCTKVPAKKHQNSNKLKSTHTAKVSLHKQISGEAHVAYFFDEAVLNKIVDQ